MSQSDLLEYLALTNMGQINPQKTFQTDLFDSRSLKDPIVFRNFLEIIEFISYDDFFIMLSIHSNKLTRPYIFEGIP